MRGRHIVRDLPQHALLRAGRLERQHLLNAFSHAFVQLKADPWIESCPRPFQLQAAFEPEEFLEDQPPLRRRPERIQQTQVRIRRRKMQPANGAPSIRQLHLLQDVGRQRIGLWRQALQNPMDQGAKHARVDLPGSFIHRDHPPGVQRRIAVVIARQDLIFRMHHRDAARVGIVLHLAE